MSTNLHIDDIGNLILRDGKLGLCVSSQYVTPPHYGGGRVGALSPYTVEQINHYYPYGGLFAESTGGDKQAFKFEDKELDRTYGLYWYDIQARQYDAAAPTWNAPDLLAEKYYSISPYAYCAGDPVNLIDPTGLYPIYNWDTGKYYDSDTNEEMTWEDAQKWLEANGVKQTYSRTEIGTYSLLSLFYMNAGGTYAFDHDSYMSEKIRSHEFFNSDSEAIQDIANLINEGEFIGDISHDLGELSWFDKGKTFLSDGFHFATFDLFDGNVPFRSLGSFSGTWKMLGISKRQKFATIEISITNQWTIASLTRNPLLGYFDFYKQHVDPLKNRFLPPVLRHFSAQNQVFKWIQVVNL